MKNISNKHNEIIFDGMNSSTKNPKCKGYYDAWTGDYGCDYKTILIC